LFLGLEFRSAILLAWNTSRIPPLWTLNLCHKFLKMIWASTIVRSCFMLYGFCFLHFRLKTAMRAWKAWANPPY
jgi:hypothetical protein